MDLGTCANPRLRSIPDYALVHTWSFALYYGLNRFAEELSLFQFKYMLISNKLQRSYLHELFTPAEMKLTQYPRDKFLFRLSTSNLRREHIGSRVKLGKKQLRE